MDYRDNHHRIAKFQLKWPSFTPPWWSGFTPPLTPIYDENGNIMGVVIAQLNKMKFAKTVGSLPENVNFGIKASTVRQFLNASGLPTKWSKRSKNMSTRELAKIAKSQTVMVMCHR